MTALNPLIIRDPYTGTARLAKYYELSFRAKCDYLAAKVGIHTDMCEDLYGDAMPWRGDVVYLLAERGVDYRVHVPKSRTLARLSREELAELAIKALRSFRDKPSIKHGRDVETYVYAWVLKCVRLACDRIYGKAA